MIMNLSSSRIITEDVNRLVAFYEHVTGILLHKYTPDFAELRTPQAALAIGSTNTLALFGGNAVATAASNR